MERQIDIARIQAHRMRLEAEQARLEAQLSAVKAEMAELEVAERVFVRLSGEGKVVADAEALSPTNAARLPPGKPENTPSYAAMIREALAHAHTLGSPGLEPAGMLSYIQGRYWPDIPPNKVGPTAWHMWKDGKLEKYGPRYRLPREEREKIRHASGVAAEPAKEVAAE